MECVKCHNDMLLECRLIIHWASCIQIYVVNEGKVELITSASINWIVLSRKDVNVWDLIYTACLNFRHSYWETLYKPIPVCIIYPHKFKIIGYL